MPATISDHSTPTVPADDPTRHLAFAQPNTDDSLCHICVVGDTYTMLLRGTDTGGKYCLIDMHVPPGGGPPMHRHDFEEMFTMLDGEAEFTFRGEKHIVRAGETINIPANSPHHFTNSTKSPMRMLCMCVPAGQDDYFIAIGDAVATRTSPPPPKSDAEKKAAMEQSLKLAPHYATEVLI